MKICRFRYAAMTLLPLAAPLAAQDEDFELADGASVEDVVRKLPRSPAEPIIVTATRSPAGTANDLAPVTVIAISNQSNHFHVIGNRSALLGGRDGSRKTG